MGQIKDMTPFGLTGAVFSQDQQFLQKARTVLKDAVGNLYLNDKSTGSVVGQQPFGGARLSGEYFNYLFFLFRRLLAELFLSIRFRKACCFCEIRSREECFP